jgi:flagellin
MADVTLSAAVRGSLLSLQSTTDLIERTQSRLSTGLKVSSAIDDPVAFFQAKTLTDRASDFTEKKDSIDQGISSLSAAVDGIEAVENLVNQLKGIANSMKSATGTQFTDLITQFNDLRSQIDLLTTDSTYQGVNLVNGTGQTLSVEFSDKSTSKLSVSSVDVTANGLNVNDVTNTSSLSTNVLAMNHNDFLAGSLTNGASISVTYVGSTVTITTASSAQTFTYGAQTITLGALTAGASSYSLTQGTTYTVSLGTATAVTLSGTTLSTALTNISATGGVALAAADGKTFVGESNSNAIDTAITGLSSALTTLRTEASSLGNNVALLQTRLEFTDSYVSTLEDGGSKLTLADINEEGANLLALQTRQQLGIQSLSFAGQAEQSVLGLFR